MASRDDGKSAATPVAPVSYAGDSIQRKILWAGLILLGIGFISKQWNINSDSGSGSSALVMCGGLKRPELNLNSSPVRQKVRNECFSTVIVAPSAPRSKVVWHAPGRVDVCFWKANRCLAWMRIGRNEIQEKTRKEIPPDYTALLFKGDPGDLEVLLSK